MESPGKVAGTSKTAERDGVKLTLSATPSEIERGGRVRVDVELVTEDGIEASLENYGRALTEGDRSFQFRVVQADEKTSPPMQGGGRKVTYTYDVEFYLADRHELPPAKVTYAKSSEKADGSPPLSANDEAGEPPSAKVDPLELTTDSVSVLVRPPGDKSLSPEELAKIRVLDPHDLPSVWSMGWWTLPIAAVAVAGVLLFMRRRGGRGPIAVVVSPHEWAYAEIARLLADHLIESGRFQEFFYRISFVVRGYVERRFGVSAPEMTTEEFLIATVSHQRLSSDYADELRPFLTACDLVKYARHEATTVECQSVLDAARQFVDRTQSLSGEQAVRGEKSGSGSHPG